MAIDDDDTDRPLTTAELRECARILVGLPRAQYVAITRLIEAFERIHDTGDTAAGDELKRRLAHALAHPPRRGWRLDADGSIAALVGKILSPPSRPH